MDFLLNLLKCVSIFLPKNTTNKPKTKSKSAGYVIPLEVMALQSGYLFPLAM